MRHFKCAYCGKTGTDMSHAQNKKFCTKECCDAFHSKKTIPDNLCKFNDGVTCESG